MTFPCELDVCSVDALAQSYVPKATTLNGFGAFFGGEKLNWKRVHSFLVGLVASVLCSEMCFFLCGLIRYWLR